MGKGESMDDGGAVSVPPAPADGAVNRTQIDSWHRRLYIVIEGQPFPSASLPIPFVRASEWEPRVPGLIR